jgi:hypothetical protein
MERGSPTGPFRCDETHTFQRGLETGGSEEPREERWIDNRPGRECDCKSTMSLDV